MSFTSWVDARIEKAAKTAADEAAAQVIAHLDETIGVVEHDVEQLGNSIVDKIGQLGSGIVSDLLARLPKWPL